MLKIRPAVKLNAEPHSISTIFAPDACLAWKKVTNKFYTQIQIIFILHRCIAFLIRIFRLEGEQFQIEDWLTGNAHFHLNCQVGLVPILNPKYLKKFKLIVLETHLASSRSSLVLEQYPKFPSHAKSVPDVQYSAGCKFAPEYWKKTMYNDVL